MHCRWFGKVREIFDSEREGLDRHVFTFLSREGKEAQGHVEGWRDRCSDQRRIRVCYV